MRMQCTQFDGIQLPSLLKKGEENRAIRVRKQNAFSFSNVEQKISIKNNQSRGDVDDADDACFGNNCLCSIHWIHRWMYALVSVKEERKELLATKWLWTFNSEKKGCLGRSKVYFRPVKCGCCCFCRCQVSCNKLNWHLGREEWCQRSSSNNREELSTGEAELIERWLQKWW